jgi:uncharacterized protein with GYD domain
MVVAPSNNKTVENVSAQLPGLAPSVSLGPAPDEMRRVMAVSPRRFDVAKQTLGDMGGAFKSIFLTMGEYDLIGVYEAPDDAVAARFTMQLGMLGNVRTKTLKAFPETAYREIVKSLSWPVRESPLRIR